LAADATVSLVWNVQPFNLTRVEFYAADSNGANTTLVGTDTFFNDGVSVPFHVPTGFNGRFSAAAFRGSGLIAVTAQNTRAYAAAPVPPPPVISPTTLSVSPVVSVNNSTFVVSEGASVTITWTANFPPETDRVEFYLSPPTGGTTAIGVDNNPSDGASILWIVQPATGATLQATAFFNGGFSPQSSSSYSLVSEPIGPQP
jgi:hypothetical protein